MLLICDVNMCSQLLIRTTYVVFLPCNIFLGPMSYSSLSIIKVKVPLLCPVGQTCLGSGKLLH